MSISNVRGTFSILPDDVVIKCLQELSPENLKAASLAQKRLWILAKKPIVWVQLCERDFRLIPPDANSAKRMYQVHSDMKRGRFLVKSTRLDGPVALIGKKFKLQDHFYVPSPESEEFRFLSFSPKMPQHCTGIWNGAELATMGKPSGYSSISLWVEKEKGCVVSRMSGVGRGLATHSSKGVMCYQWHGNELLTLWGGKDMSIFFQSWDVSQEPKRNFNVMLFYQGSLFLEDGEMNYERFAWDGEYLAIRSPTGADIWQIKQGLLTKIGSIKQDESPLVSLKWNGNFLFAGNQAGKVTIYNRETNVTHTIDCSLPNSGGNQHVYDFVFRGNLVVIAMNNGFNSNLILCQQREDGSLQMIRELISHNFEETEKGDRLEFVMKGDSLAVVINNELSELRFGESYEAIYQELAEGLKKDGIKGIKAQHYHDRLSRMPSREVAKKINNEHLDQLEEGSSKKARTTGNQS